MSISAAEVPIISAITRRSSPLATRSEAAVCLSEYNENPAAGMPEARNKLSQNCCGSSLSSLTTRRFLCANSAKPSNTHQYTGIIDYARTLTNTHAVN